MGKDNESHQPIADRVSVSHYVSREEVGMYPNQALGKDSAAHIVNVRLISTSQSGVVTQTERVEDPCLPILRV